MFFGSTVFLPLNIMLVRSICAMHEAAACSFIPMDRICRLSKHHDLFSPLFLLWFIWVASMWRCDINDCYEHSFTYLLEHYNGWDTEASAFGFCRYFQLQNCFTNLCCQHKCVEFQFSTSLPTAYITIVITVHTPSNLSKYRDDLRDSMLQMQSFTYSLNH